MMLKRPLESVVVGVTLISLSLAKGAEAKPNIVYLLSDNQSYYEMSCHGHAEVKTPNIDRLAQQGVDFQQFYAPPFCAPSRSVMMTGRYALRSGVHDTIGGRSIMHKDDPTLANMLGQYGYVSGIFGKWHLGGTYPYRPDDRGFNEVFIHHGGGVGQLEDYFKNDHYDPAFTHNGNVVHTEGYSSDVIFNKAINWIKQQKDNPFFCFVSTPAVHAPHQAPKGYKGKALYGMIENFDMNVGRMMATLDELGLSENTVLVFASDQGMHDRGAPHGQLKAGVNHDSNHHVPFVVRMPGAKPYINKDLTGMIDFVPTMLDICGIEIPESMDGVSLKPLLTGNESEYPEGRVLIIQCPRQRNSKKWANVSVKKGKWRLTSKDTLYDIDADPLQKINIASQYPEMVQTLSAAYEEYWSSIPEQGLTLSRHILGAEDGPEISLCGVDWYTGAKPWTGGNMHADPAKKKNQNGAWPVTITADGTYRFELRRFPREADKAIGLERAKIKLGSVVKEKSFHIDDVAVTFELELKAGEYDLQTWLNPADNTMNYGALFVYVSTVR